MESSVVDGARCRGDAKDASFFLREVLRGEDLEKEPARWEPRFLDE
jgi:hypothetical protein